MLHQRISTRIWKPPNLGTLKVNTDMTISKNKIGIGIIVCINLGILLLAKVISRIGCFTIECRELLAIIEGYSTGSSQDNRIVIESDSLLAVNSLISNSEDISKLGILLSVFRSSIDVFSISFSHVYRTSDSPTIF